MSTAAHSPEALAARRGPTSTEYAAGAGLLGLEIACALSPAHIQDGPVICPFRRVTGLPCPGCGLTRSWVYLTHGDWHQALTSNPFGYVLAFGVLVASGYAAWSRLRRERPKELDTIVKAPVVLATAVLWLAFGIVRLVVVAT